MGTHWRARVVEADRLVRNHAEKIIRDTLAFVVTRMSPWEAASDLSRFRAAEAGAWVAIDPHTFRVLSRALEIAELTDGRYDPTIGCLTDVLGFGPSDPAVAALPGSARAAEACAATNHRRVRLDVKRHAILQPGGFQLDLCSIAKGYAVDLVVERLQHAGVLACFVEIGGEARGLGCKPNGQPWWCQLESSANDARESPPTVAAACNLGIATSGNALRKRILPDGSELGHILNPRRGEPLSRTLESVSIFAPTCMEADAFATALFLLGPHEGRHFAERHDLAALWVERLPHHGYREHWSPRFAELLE
jgi:thiamine biosynthesis lipoprotein